MQIRSALPTTLLLVTCIIGTTHADETCVDYRPWDIEFSRTWIPDDPWDIAHAADHLFTACGDGGLRIFAESTPDQWTEVSQTPVPGFAFGVAAEGQLAVVAAGELVVLDVTDPTAPVPLASVPISGRCVRLTSGFAVVGRDQPGLVSVVDLRVPSSPTVTDVVVPALDGTAAPGLPHDVETFGGVAAFGFDGGVFLLDVSDPENPASLGDAIVSHSVRDISERNGILYLAADSGGLVILDATDPLDPVQIANYGGGYARAVLVVGDTAVLPGLRFLDVSDPHTPTLFRTRGMSSLMSLFEIRPGEVCAGFHVLAAPPGGGELVTFDVPELANPTLEDPAPFPSYRHVATDGDRLATFEDGNFELWDVRQPLDPQLLGLVSAQVGYGVTFHGADLEGDVAVGGGTYEGFFDYYDALKTFDVSDPQAPQYTGSVVGLPEGTGGWVRLHGGLAYVPSGEGIRRYATPDLSYIGTISGVMDFWSAMEFAGDFLCVTGEGLEVFDLPGGGVAAYLPLPETYTAETASDVRVEIYDATGRRIRTIAKGPLVPGSHQILWDGRDDAGRPTASGVYFAQVRSATEALAGKLVHLK